MQCLKSSICKSRSYFSMMLKCCRNHFNRKGLEKNNNLDYNILNKEVGTMDQTHPSRQITIYLNSRAILFWGQDDYFLFV